MTIQRKHTQADEERRRLDKALQALAQTAAASAAAEDAPEDDRPHRPAPAARDPAPAPMAAAARNAVGRYSHGSAFVEMVRSARQERDFDFLEEYERRRSETRSTTVSDTYETTEAPAAPPVRAELMVMQAQSRDMLAYMERRDQALFALLETVIARSAPPPPPPPQPAALPADTERLVERLERLCALMDRAAPPDRS